MVTRKQNLTKTHGNHEGLNTHKTNDKTRDSCEQCQYETMNQWQQLRYT